MSKVVTVWRLEVAVEEAFTYFDGLGEDHHNPLNITLAARRFAPTTSKQVIECLTENPALTFLEAPRGHLVLDVLIASVTEVIASQILKRYQENISKTNSEMAKKQALRDSIMR